VDYFVKTLLTSVTICITALCTMHVNADAYDIHVFEGQKVDVSEILSPGKSMVEVQLLAENTEEPAPDVKSGDLIIPGASENKATEKKCVTVCDKWGEECIYNPRSGRKCRRVCKSFGKECI